MDKPLVQVSEAERLTKEGVVPVSRKLDGYIVNRWIYQLAIPLFLIVGLVAFLKRWRRGHGNKYRFESQLFNKGAEIISDIQRNGGNGMALHLLYRLRDERRMLASTIERFWVNIPIIQAVQNRAVLIRRIMGELILSHPHAKILEFAAGLAEPLVWAVHDTESEGRGPKEILLTDISRSSLKQALGVANFFQVKASLACEWLNLTKLDQVRGVIQKSRPDLVEMIGFIDYVDDAYAIELFREIHDGSASGTVLVTGNVLPIPFWQLFFIEQAYGWPRMQYRTKLHLERLLRQAGYENVEIQIEPNNIFAIAIAS